MLDVKITFCTTRDLQQIGYIHWDITLSQIPMRDGEDLHQYQMSVEQPWSTNKSHVEKTQRMIAGITVITV